MPYLALPATGYENRFFEKFATFPMRNCRIIASHIRLSSAGSVAYMATFGKTTAREASVYQGWRAVPRSKFSLALRNAPASWSAGSPLPLWDEASLRLALQIGSRNETLHLLRGRDTRETFVLGRVFGWRLFWSACGSGRGLFPLTTNSRPCKETKAALIICHPELAKDLTTCQSA